MRLFGSRKRKIYYVVDGSDWVIRREGESIVRRLKQKYKLNVEMVKDFVDPRDSIVHFGARNLYLPEAYKHVHASNKVIFTWYHGTDEDVEFIHALPAGAQRADYVHTSCNLSRADLIRWGVPAGKIVLIPIGLETKLFHPVPESARLEARKRMGIPDKAVVIGSFQKDGANWEDGMEPKLIKGPDVFCDVLDMLKHRHELFVILTGPARGYVKKRLADSGIAFRHFEVQDYADVAQYYNLLDLYPVCSRAEGGPKALMESQASGVPIISTRVGMAPEVIQDGVNGLLTDIEDRDGLVAAAERVLGDAELRGRMITAGLESVGKYDYDNLVKDYYEQIYQHLL